MQSLRLHVTCGRYYSVMLCAVVHACFVATTLCTVYFSIMNLMICWPTLDTIVMVLEEILRSYKNDNVILLQCHVDSLGLFVLGSVNFEPSLCVLINTNSCRLTEAHYFTYLVHR